MNKICGIASIPDREKLLKRTIESIYSQFDNIYIGLNNYTEIPTWLIDSKITAELHDNKLGDAIKFLHVSDAIKYFYSCDDDLVYPKNYADYLEEGINKYHGIVTLHGRNYPIPVHNFRSWINNYHCLRTVNSNHKVNFGGTGVMAFDVNVFSFGMDIFKEKNMADCFVAKEAWLKGIPIFVLKHNGNYLTYQKPNSTIWKSNNNFKKQTEILKSFMK